MKIENQSKRDTVYQAMKNISEETIRTLPSGASAYFLIFVMTFLICMYANPEFKDVVDNLIEPYRYGIFPAFNTGLAMTITYIALLWVSRAIVGDYSYSSYSYKQHESNQKHFALLSASIKPLSEERIKRVACHESGHLLGLSFFGEEPTCLRVEVKKSHAPFLGTLTYDYDEDFLCSKDAVESAMKMTLAGAIAEEIIFGDCLIGQQTDIEKWERYARNWLASFSHSYNWFVCPSNESEAMVNAKTLKTIKDFQSKQVSELLSNNTDVLIEATDIISAGMVLEGDVLLELLRKVKNV